MKKAFSNEPLDLDKVSLPMFGLAIDDIFHGKSHDHKHIKGQLLYAVEGLLHVYLADQYFIVPPSRAVWIPSLVNHAINSSVKVKYRSLYFDCALFPNLPKVTAVIHVSFLLQSLILRACEFSTPYHEDSSEFRIARVITDEISRAVISPFSVPIPKERRLQKIFAYLKTHLANRDNIEMIAHQFGLSGRTLTRLCKKEFGVNFDEWRSQIKLIIAIGLLSEGQSTSDVSQALGYSNDSAFISMFKRLSGRTPSMFRKESMNLNRY